MYQLNINVMNEQVIIEDCANKYVVQVHTNFDISEYSGYQEAIEGIEGVEHLNTFGASRYSYIIPFGKMFDKETISSQIIEVTKEFFNYINDK